MLFSKPTLITLSLLPSLLSASGLGNLNAYTRRAAEVDCIGRVAARTNDSCERYARSFKLTIDELLALNPGLDCDHWDDQGYYCIEARNATVSDSTSSNSTTTSNESETTTTTAESETPTDAATLQAVPEFIGVAMTVVVGYLASSVLL
ncbi:hypothetical protein BDV12DRAFT_181330 [Aspergillus spectabilis]